MCTLPILHASPCSRCSQPPRTTTFIFLCNFDPNLIPGFLDLAESISNWHIGRFGRFCRAHERYQQTDRPRYSVCSNRLHLAIDVMRPKKWKYHKTRVRMIMENLIVDNIVTNALIHNCVQQLFIIMLAVFTQSCWPQFLWYIHFFECWSSHIFFITFTSTFFGYLVSA